MLASDLDLDSDRETAAGTEGFARDLEDGRGLLALVFGTLDEREHAPDEIEGDGFPSRGLEFGEYLLCGAVALDIGFEDGIEEVVGRERVGIELAWAKLG